MCFGGGVDPAEEARKQEAARRAQIDQGLQSINRSFSTFDDNFYNQRAQAYVNYALPFLSRQFDTTRRAVGANIANRGLLGGSVERSEKSNLQRAMEQNRQQTVATGWQQANQLKGQVEDSRNQITSQLYQSADPLNAGAAASRAVAGLASPSTFTPLGQMFSGVLNDYYTRSLINADNAQAARQQQNMDQLTAMNVGALPKN